MAGYLLLFAGILVFAYLRDGRMLLAEGTKGQWVCYIATFVLGYGGCLLYAMNQNMPDLLEWVWRI